ncbi:MAG: carbohydrate binding domain-containing protein [Kineosporiaceae bacterium]
MPGRRIPRPHHPLRPRRASSHRRDVLVVAVATAALTAAAVGFPQVGATAGSSAGLVPTPTGTAALRPGGLTAPDVQAAASTSTSRCTGCMTHKVFGFEDGTTGGLSATGGAVISVSRDLPRTGRRSLMIDRATIGAGVRGDLTVGKPNSSISLAVRVEPVPVSGQDATVPFVQDWVTLTLRGDGKPVTVTAAVGENDWTSLGSWVGGRTVGLELTLVQSCGAAVGRRLFVDDVRVATLGVDGASRDGSAAAPSVVAPAEAEPTPTPSAPACTTPTPTATPTPSPTPTAGPLGQDFEDGSTGGWTAIGSSSVAVARASVRGTGERVLRITGVRADAPSGTSLTLPSLASTGRGQRYQVSLWVRVAPTKGLTPAAAVAAAKRLRLDVTGAGPVTTQAVGLRGKRWVHLSAEVEAPDPGAPVTLTVTQERPVGCGPMPAAMGTIDLDDVVVQPVVAAPTVTTTRVTLGDPGLAPALAPAATPTRACG